MAGFFPLLCLNASGVLRLCVSVCLCVPVCVSVVVCLCVRLRVCVCGRPRMRKVGKRQVRLADYSSVAIGVGLTQCMSTTC